MDDTTNAVARDERLGGVTTVPLAAAAETYKRGQFLNLNAAGYGKMGEDAADERFAGIADEEVEVLAEGEAGDESIQVEQTGVRRVTFTSTLTQADVGKAAYVADNWRMARVGDVENAVFAGIITRVLSASEAEVDIGPATRQVADLADAIS